ncbi:MAG: hypothetical protein ACK4SX_13255 [Alcanivoracaceae bacterium]
MGNTIGEIMKQDKFVFFVVGFFSAFLIAIAIFLLPWMDTIVSDDADYFESISVVPIDYNGDGNHDGRSVHVDGFLVAFIADRNGDGNDDYWVSYDGSEWGMPVSFLYDANHNGYPNIRGIYLQGVLQYVEYDYDEDGHFEHVDYYFLDLISMSVWKDSSGREVKKIIYEHGKPVAILFDCDNDGLAETKRELDWRGEPVPYLCGQD